MKLPRSPLSDNTRAPDATAVKKMYIEELNPRDGTGPSVNFEVKSTRRSEGWGPQRHVLNLDKTNAAGTLVTVYRMKTNITRFINLAATELGTDLLPKENTDEGRPIYKPVPRQSREFLRLFSLIDKVRVI